MIRLTRWERPVKATIWTNVGWVRVEWRDVAGDWCWFSSGSLEARKEAVPAIEHVEQMCQSMH